MICKPCKEAGGNNARALSLPIERLAEASVLTHVAGLKHGICNGRCDCQHQVGRTALAGREPK